MIALDVLCKKKKTDLLGSLVFSSYLCREIEKKNMNTSLHTSQQQQLQSFWNLIQASDESVQQGLYQLLYHKFAPANEPSQRRRSSFFDLKGILHVSGNNTTDQALMDEYLEEKYGL